MVSRFNVKLLSKINTNERESDSGATSASVAGPSNQKRGDIYEQLKNLDDALYVANQEEITCSMCKKNVWPGDGIILKECLHNFCIKCITEYIDSTNTPEIDCPFISEDYVCPYMLTHPEIQGLLSPESWENFLERSLNCLRFDGDDIAFDDFDIRRVIGPPVVVRPKIREELVARAANERDSKGDEEEEEEQNEEKGEEVKPMAPQIRDLIKYCLTPGCQEVFMGNFTSCECAKCDQRNCFKCNKIHQSRDCIKIDNDENYNEIITAQRINKMRTPNARPKLKPQPEINQEEEYNVKVFKNPESMDCPICLDTIDPNGGVLLMDCLHFICTECLTQHVRLNDHPEIKCPHDDGKTKCQKIINQTEIKEVISPDVWDMFLKRSLQHAATRGTNVVHCLTPDCDNFIIDDGGFQFMCPKCEKWNCLKCKAIHEETCEEFKDSERKKELDGIKRQDEANLEEMLRQGMAMKCPKCSAIVAKDEGCDWMKCTFCGTEICWATKGPRWGPGGHGDTSGGCKCGYFNGVRCTPTCNYCH